MGQTGRHLPKPVLLLSSIAFGLSGRCVQAQVLDLSGGGSTLYQAEGGQVTLRGLNYETGASMGVVAGKLVEGGHIAYRNQSGRYLLGMESLKLDLPTDVFSMGHRLTVVGADVQTTRRGMALEAFAGATSTQLSSPLFLGAQPNQATAALLMEKRLSANVMWTTQALYASTFTVLNGVAWKPKKDLTLGASTGLGGTARYNAVSLDLDRPDLNLKAAYIDAGAGFHRTGSQIDTAPEPIRENIQVNWHPKFAPQLSFTGGRQNLIVSTTPTASPLISGPTATDSNDSLSASLRAKPLSLNASVMHSTYLSESNIAFTASGGLALSPRLQLGASYFGSRLLGDNSAIRPVSTVVVHGQELLSSRWGANQVLTFANGQVTAGFGGSFLSNIATISASYETFYVPTRPTNPFQQSLVLDVQMNLWGRVQVHAGTFVGPTGKLLYTGDVHSVMARAGTPVATTTQSGFGPSLLAGRVVDDQGNPIEGAAIDIDGKVVYTDSDGNFFYREKRPNAHPINVLSDQFLDGNSYWVKSKPVSAASTLTPGAKAVIVVQRNARRKSGIAIGPKGAEDEEAYGAYVPYGYGAYVPYVPPNRRGAPQASAMIFLPQLAWATLYFGYFKPQSKNVTLPSYIGPGQPLPGSPPPGDSK